MVKHESHLCRVIGHRLGHYGRPCEVALVVCVEQVPLAGVLGEHSLHNSGELGQDLGVQFRVVNPPVSRADGDCSRIIECADSSHLHNGNLSVFGHSKLRLGKLKRGIVVPNAKSGRALARHGPTPCDVGEFEHNGFLLLHPRVVHDGHVKTLLEFARQENQRSGSRFEIVALERGACGGRVVHAQDPVGRASALDRHYRVGAVHVFTDVKEHIGELKLTVVVTQHKVDSIAGGCAGRDEAATIHTNDTHLHVLCELELGVIQRDERHLNPVGTGRDDDLAAKILVVGDGAGGAVHSQAHRHVPNRAGRHLRTARHHAAAVAACILIIPTEPGVAFSWQATGVPLKSMQHTVQRRDIKRPVSAHNRFGQGGTSDLNLVNQLSLGVDQEQLSNSANANHSLRHKHDGSARWHPQFVLPFQLACLVESVDFSICGAEEDVAKHIRNWLAKDHSPGVKRPLLHTLLDTDQLVQRPGWRLVTAIAPVAVSGRRIDRFRLPGCAKINQVLVIHRRGSHYTFTPELECPQCLAKRIQGIQLAVVAGHEDSVIGGNRRRSGNPATGLKRPLYEAILPHGIYLVIERADIDGAVCANGRGGTLHTGAKRGDPFQRAKGVHSIEVAVSGPDVNGSVQVDSRGRCDGASHLERPLHGPVRVDGVETSGTGTHVDEAVWPDGRGGDHPGIALEFPLGRAEWHFDLKDHHPLGWTLFIDIR